MATAKEKYPELFVMRDDDPRQRKRTVPMEVMSLGYSRTGTMTIKTALDMLGMDTWHYFTMAENPRDIALWLDALRVKFDPSCKAKVGIEALDRELFDNLLGNWSAVTDQPAILLAPELVKAYPEAKIILVERDTDSWYKAYAAGVIDSVTNPSIPFVRRLNPSYVGVMSDQTDLIAKHYFNVPHERERFMMANPPFFETWRQNARPTYLAHNEMVKRITPPEKLLRFKLEDGWEPLCKFLGKPIPDVPFPHVNETKAVQEKTRLYVAEGFRRSAVMFARRELPVLVAVLAVAFWWFYR